MEAKSYITNEDIRENVGVVPIGNMGKVNKQRVKSYSLRTFVLMSLAEK